MARAKPIILTGKFAICKKCNCLKDHAFFPKRTRSDKIDEYTCKECKKIYYVNWYGDNREYLIAKMKNYYEVNKDKQSALAKIHYIENKEKYNNSAKEWRANNPHMMTAYTRNYNLSRSKRTPIWADITEINNFYRNCPEGLSVDHIHPLHGKLISGFHVVNNLQYLTRNKNSEKSNKFNTYWVFYEPTTIRIETSGPEGSIFKIERRR